MLKIHDDYVAYCLDEACCYILDKLNEGKRPFFGGRDKKDNSETVETLKSLGAEVRQI